MNGLICNIELDYSNSAKLKELEPEDYDRLREAFKSFKFPDTQEEIQSYSSYSGIEFVSDLSMMTEMGLKPALSRIRGQFSEPHALRIPTDSRQPQPSIVNISIPNNSLFSVRRVIVIEDSCTDNLQSYLKLNWRIVAVCPPNDTRRPDYVLGHVEEFPEFPEFP